jgi:hypothetical protein
MASCMDRQLHSLLAHLRRRAWVLPDGGFKDEPVGCRQTRTSTTIDNVRPISPAGYGNTGRDAWDVWQKLEMSMTLKILAASAGCGQS